MKESIAFDRLKHFLQYDSGTGIFIRARCVPGYRKGSIAGCTGQRGYISIKLDGKSYKAHRLAWFFVYKRWPSGEIDHIDGDTSNNRIANLREATHVQNMTNCKKYVSNTSNFKGVCWHKATMKWTAYIQANGKRMYLGLFNDPEKANAAYVDAAKIYHGQLARVA